jgi:hypothetical protein
MTKVQRTADPPTLHPTRLYDVDEVRVILNPRHPLHPDTVYRIPEKMLPKTKVGPRRGRTMWKGLDLMRYLGMETGSTTMGVV